MDLLWEIISTVSPQTGYLNHLMLPVLQEQNKEKAPVAHPEVYWYLYHGSTLWF